MRYLLVLVALLMFACQEEPVPDTDETPESDFFDMDVQEVLDDGNRRLWEEEDHLINMYVQNQQLEVQSTGTGVRYQIFEKGGGAQIQEGQEVLVDFTITLLNGDTCYTSLNKQPELFLVGMDAVESGLHEGIQHFSVGDKGILIIPFRLGHGLIGDQEKIPALSTIVYHIEVLDAR